MQFPFKLNIKILQQRQNMKIISKLLLTLIIGLGFSNVIFSAEEEKPELTSYQNIPQGWRTEVIPFPLDFAPEIDLQGVEELIFSPDMFNPEASGFFSYVFVWNVKQNTISQSQMKTYLVKYFAGPYKAVAKQKEADVVINLSAPGKDGSFQGSADWIEPFKTKQKQRLNFTISYTACENSDDHRWYFLVSPQENSHSVWKQLKAIENKSC